VHHKPKCELFLFAECLLQLVLSHAAKKTLAFTIRFRENKN
jgi:hypothetical protein